MSDKKPSAMCAIAENPVAVLFLGACPVMAMSGNVLSAVGIGLAMTVVMVLTNLVMYALGKGVPKLATAPAIILVSAFFVSAVQLVMGAFLPSIAGMLGVYLAAVAVNFAVYTVGKRSTVAAKLGTTLVDGLFTGLGFTLAAFVMAAVREILGSGSFAGLEIAFFQTYNIPLLTKAPGGFIVFAVLLAVISAIRPDCAGGEAVLADISGSEKGE